MARMPGYWERLRFTARLYRNPAYRAALREARLDSWEGPGVTVEEMIAKVNERRRADQRARDTRDD